MYIPFNDTMIMNDQNKEMDLGYLGNWPIPVFVCNK
jgi:hypothetical protein